MLFDDQSIVFLDGEYVKLKDAKPHFFSQTFHYGNGVFEGMRSYETADGTRVFRCREHYKRLLEVAGKLRIQLPYTKEQLSRITYEVLRRNGLSQAYIRPLAYVGENMTLRSTQQAHLCIAAYKWEKLPGDKQLSLMIASYRRPDPRSGIQNAKICGYYVNHILATTEAREKGYDDAIMLDVEGNVACGSGANIFIEKNEVIYTPAPGHIIKGITRSVIMELATAMGIKVVEKSITPQELYEADGAFLTGTAIEIVPVGKVDQKPFKMVWQDTIGHMLSRQYRQLVTRSDNYQHTLI
ncbi:MAG: branched-chain amino acid transaminase [Bacteroidetes bacterium]|nr:MAG: branched-chain amino acid transaminase [Bacteroidota bacterium]